MNIYLYIYFGLCLLGLGIAVEQHGKPRTGNHNFWMSLGGNILGIFLLYKGGLFQ